MTTTQQQANNVIYSSRLRPHVRNLAATPGESRWIIRYVADSKPVSVFGPLRENMTSCTKPEVYITYCTVSSKTDRATAASYVYRISREVWTCGFFSIFTRADRHTDPQTHRHTSTLIAILCTPPPGSVKVKVKASHRPTGYRALGPELMPVYRQSARRWP